MTGYGDNAFDMTAKQAIRRVVRAVEDIEAQIADLNADKSEFYKEAKATGLDVTVIRAVVAERRKRAKDPDGHAERSALFDVYMAALVEDGAGIATRARARSSEPENAPREPVEIAADIAALATVDPVGANAVVETVKALAREPVPPVPEKQYGDPGDIPAFLDRRGRA